MHEGVLHILDVQGPKKGGSDKARLAALEHEIFKCQGTVEHGVSVNHSMTTNFIRENKLDKKNMGEILSKLQDRIDHLQDQIYELQGQNYECKSRFHRMSFAAGFRTLKTKFSFYDGESTP
ncbi:40S ribosomal protein S5-1 [Hordeum vulgare]|nr:40S ribosomal protein S5-1 [Hordeum vulgare]